MTFTETQKLCTMLHMAYASFLPRDIHEAAGKIKIWADALKNESPAAAEAAFRLYIKSSEFAPTIAEFLRFIRACDTGTRRELLTADLRPKYECDEAHRDAVMGKILKELR